MSFDIKGDETAAREYIRKIYTLTKEPLPPGWDDPDILQSLAVVMARNQHQLNSNSQLSLIFREATIGTNN